MARRIKRGNETAITEAGKRESKEDASEGSASIEGSAVFSDQVLAQRFARRLAAAARGESPQHAWTVEDLRDVFELAVEGSPTHEIRILEGRYFRKRLRDRCARALRYGEPFACVVMTLRVASQDGAYGSVLDAIVERLRRSDFLFLYKRRFAIILPGMTAHGVAPLAQRVRTLLAVGAGEEIIEDLSSMVFPDTQIAETQAMLDWAEDRLRAP